MNKPKNIEDEPKGRLVNRAWFAGPRDFTESEILESEIRQARKLGHWKHANDLQRHLDNIRRRKHL